MPGTMIKEITFPDGITRKVEELNFNIYKEDWNVYQTDDGTIIKLKSIVHKIYWVLDDHGNRQYTPDGDPFILARSLNQIVASEK